MSLQTPLPFAFAQRDEFLRLPLEGRTKHLWAAHEFCTKEIGGKRFADAELQRNIGVLRRMLLGVAKHMAAKLRAEGAWKDSEDSRWPRNHTGSDVEHWYDSGAFPPQLLALPGDLSADRDLLVGHSESLLDEMIAWVETPAGIAAVDDKELQALVADRQAFLVDEPLAQVAESA